MSYREHLGDNLREINEAENILFNDKFLRGGDMYCSLLTINKFQDISQI